MSVWRSSHRVTAHERTTPGEDVIPGEGHLWQNGECVAAVHYLLVGSAMPNDDALRRWIVTLATLQ